MSGAAPSASTDPAPGAVWVFGYGSLIWRPGFSYSHRQPSLLEGWHRAFCRYSFHHRGTPDRPGLVVGLRRGKSCVGMAYAIGVEDAPKALAYLDEREGEGYLRTEVTLRLLEQNTAPRSAGHGSVAAWAYIPNPDHPSYFGEENLENLTRLVATGRGRSGTALDYLRELISHLKDIEVEEPALAAILHAAENHQANFGKRELSRPAKAAKNSPRRTALEPRVETDKRG